MFIYFSFNFLSNGIIIIVLSFVQYKCSYVLTLCQVSSLFLETGSHTLFLLDELGNLLNFLTLGDFLGFLIGSPSVAAAP